MDESDFWRSLEFRVCDELARDPRPEVRALWCDGFLPDEYDLERGRIAGDVWIGVGPRQQARWNFVLSFAPITESCSSSD